MKILGGYEDFVDIFGCHHKSGLVVAVISMHFRVFFKVEVQNGNSLGAAKISNLFWLCLIFLIFFWGT